MLVNTFYVRITIKTELKSLYKKFIFSYQLNLLKSVFSLPTSRYFSRPINTQWLGPKSFLVSDIYVCEVEPYVVTPARPWIYKRYIDDTYARRKKNTRNTLFNSSNSYHKNINYLVKESYKIFGYKNNKTWQWNQNSGLHWTSKALTG